ncbi:MAG: PAS domain S-box protein [Nocardioidaceae bacterium]
MGPRSEAPVREDGLLLPPRPASVAAARTWVREMLEDADRPDLVEPVALVVSEIVTNALLHAGTEIGVSARLTRHSLRVDVRDGSPHLPFRRRYATTAGTGRGLMMLESLVDRWGVTRVPDGKSVWFEISGDPDGPTVAMLADTGEGHEGPAPTGRAVQVATGPATVGSSVAVELQNMPLLLHAAWQEHAEALLREYLLASLDADVESSVRRHAEATDAIAVLEEHIPRTSVTIDADRLMQEAVEPAVSAARVKVQVPAASVAHFETLDRAIESALDLSREGLGLTPPTQPEVQAFRRWLCRQVVAQAAGRRPEPWVVPDDEPRHRPASVDTTFVEASARAVIAADAASVMLAVSPAAARLLGYDRPEDLVGRRVLTIVPERYRQAHVAGFTMYHLVGRRPLLDRPVVVPALRRDGSELEVELEVSEHAAGAGVTLLVADLRAAGPDQAAPPGGAG